MSIGLLVSYRKELESNFKYTLYKIFILCISISVVFFMLQLVLLFFSINNSISQIIPIILGVLATYILAYVFYIFNVFLPKIYLYANYEEDITLIIDSIYNKNKEITELLKNIKDENSLPVKVDKVLYDNIHLNYTLFMRDIEFLYSTFTILDDKDSLLKLNQIKHVKTLIFTNEMITHNDYWLTFRYFHSFLEHIKQKYPKNDRPIFIRSHDF